MFGGAPAGSGPAGTPPPCRARRRAAATAEPPRSARGRRAAGPGRGPTTPAGAGTWWSTDAAPTRRQPTASTASLSVTLLPPTHLCQGCLQPRVFTELLPSTVVHMLPMAERCIDTGGANQPQGALTCLFRPPWMSCSTAC
ncbi:hypothetical protein CA850_26740 [Micromonospora echinospora]|nr:hypothetical protein CA850_26740 [Micromonospora echinospora]